MTPVRALLWLSLVLAGCSPPANNSPDAGADTEPEPTVFDFAIGRLDGDGAFAPIGAGETAEITVGFQGLIFIDLALLADAGVPVRFMGDGNVHFSADSSQDFGFQDNFVEFTADHDGGRLCRNFRVPFGQDLALLVGQEITLEIELYAADWAATSAATFRIVDDETCTEQPDGTFVCE